MARHSLKLRVAGLLLLIALHPDSSSAWQKEGTRGRSFRSPLLEGLRNSIEESNLIEGSGAESTLLEQLRAADRILSDARAQNRYALRLAARQSRVGIAATSPNILLITVDRLAAGDPGCCGQDVIQTPSMDELARGGMRFTNWHSGSPESLPARWSLLTGQMLHRLPRNIEDRFHIADRQVTMADALWKAGYLTAFFGLWRNGDNPQTHGFQNWSGFLSGRTACDPFPESIHVDGARVRIVENSDGRSRVSGIEMISSELKAWLNHQRRHRRQLFVHLSVPAFADLDASDSNDPLSAKEYQRRVERADQFVGRILKTLDETGLSGRTLVILTAESGPHPRCHSAVEQLKSLGETRISQEGLRLGDIRVPCIVRWPGVVAQGSTNDQTWSAIDLMPTFLSIAMARDQPLTDGLSLQPTFQGKKQESRPLLYWQSSRGGTLHQAAWKDGWKAFKAGRSKSVQLYRLKDDPAERVDRAAEFPDILESLIRR